MSDLFYLLSVISVQQSTQDNLNWQEETPQEIWILTGHLFRYSLPAKVLEPHHVSKVIYWVEIWGPLMSSEWSELTAMLKKAAWDDLNFVT